MMKILFDDNTLAFQLNIPEMDSTHAEFIDLVNRTASARGEEFNILFNALINHTRDHFENEKQLMQTYRFPAIEEHLSEHTRVLSDMRQLQQRVERGFSVMAKNWVEQQLPEWFGLHLTTMDAALANHIRLTINDTANDAKLTDAELTD